MRTEHAQGQAHDENAREQIGRDEAASEDTLPVYDSLSGAALNEKAATARKMAAAAEPRTVLRAIAIYADGRNAGHDIDPWVRRMCDGCIRVTAARGRPTPIGVFLTPSGPPSLQAQATQVRLWITRCGRGNAADGRWDAMSGKVAAIASNRLVSPHDR